MNCQYFKIFTINHDFILSFFNDKKIEIETIKLSNLYGDNLEIYLKSAVNLSNMNELSFLLKKEPIYLGNDNDIKKYSANQILYSSKDIVAECILENDLLLTQKKETLYSICKIAEDITNETEDALVTVFLMFQVLHIKDKFDVHTLNHNLNSVIENFINHNYVYKDSNLDSFLENELYDIIKNIEVESYIVLLNELYELVYSNETNSSIISLSNIDYTSISLNKISILNYILNYLGIQEEKGIIFNYILLRYLKTIQ